MVSRKGSMREYLLKQIEKKEVKLGVVGLGYVGLPLAVECAKAGFKTVGLEVSEEKAEAINAGKNYIQDVKDEDLKAVVETKMLRATADFTEISGLEFLIICVPTPLDEHKQPNLDYIVGSVQKISRNMTPNTVVVLESTTYPGTTEELILPILKESGLESEKDFYVGYSPERVDPGNKNYTVENIPKVVGGLGVDATDVIAKLYEGILKSSIHKVSSPKVAEMEKLLENIYRNINIGLANEMALICNKMDINVWEVIDAAKTKPYGFTAFYPGPGIGGHCIPLDPGYLLWKAKEYNYHMKLIQTASEINDYMPEHVVDRCFKILNQEKKALNGAKILICGVAYKEDIDDARESPVLEVMENLLKYQVDLSFYDPFIPAINVFGQDIKSVLDLEELNGYDMVIIGTAHTGIDYDKIVASGLPIFDTKNALRNTKKSDNVHLL